MKHDIKSEPDIFYTCKDMNIEIFVDGQSQGIRSVKDAFRKFIKRRHRSAFIKAVNERFDDHTHGTESPYTVIFSLITKF